MQESVVAGAPRFRILGPVEMLDGGETVRLRSRRQRLMLTILLLDANRAVPADRLIEELWGDQLPDDPAGALRTQVSRLRRALPTVAQLVTEPRGYRLTVDPDDVDVWRFKHLLTAADHRAGDDALRFLDDALALWHVHPLDEFVDRPFAQIEQRRLGELHDSAREQRLSLLLAAGRAPEAAAAAEALLADQPERERARAVLMEALYRLGRVTEALEAFQSWRRALGERGLEPSPALRDVEMRILRHTVDGDPETTAAGREPIPNTPVPRAVSSFIGRDTDLLGVADLLDTARLVTLWGAGGVGKTRLALEVAAAVTNRYRDGVHVCDLTAGSDVARGIASSVGVHERSGRRLEAQLVDRLDGRRLLLILDNCEHVLHATASIAEHLVRSTSGVDVLATSRERLGVDGEHLWEVVPLDADRPNSPAVELFVDRARATSPSFHPSAEDREVIADLCRRLDGLPLALELGAARIRGFSLQELLGTLDVRPDVLRGGAGRPRRHRSLRAVIDWSYSLLTPVDQLVFNRLAVFRGAFGLDAARAVVSDDDLDSENVTVAVLALLDRALLAERAEEPTRRYSMLDTVRRYGIERLERDQCLDRAAERHARWILDQTERAASGLAGPDEATWATTIEDSLNELRAAHRWLVGHDLDGALRLTAALRPYALWRGHSEIFRWAEVTAAAASGTGSPLLAQALLAASTGAWQRGDLAGARTAADAIPGAGQPTQTRRAALEASADVALLTGDLDRAQAEFTEAYETALAAGDELQAVWDIGSAAVAASYTGDTERALHLAAAASKVAEQCGSPSARAFAHFAMGETLAREQPHAAETHLRQAIEHAAVADTRFVAGLAEVALAASRSRQQDIPAALTHCQSAITRWHLAGAWTPLWVTIRTVIALLVRAAALEDATVLLAAAQSARTGAPSFGVDAATMQNAAEQLRSALGDDTFERYLASGRSMSEEEAQQFAVEALERASTTLSAQ
ncbi:MAG: winged helix-turn-helix domain-containing protein [Acidimicrobiia bacterium]|nr:winged helix-turn-helix domain-containing protein [Acidimicrobiia bacterium]